MSCLVSQSWFKKKKLPNVNPSMPSNEPNHPPRKTMANVLSRLEAAASKPTVQRASPRIAETSNRIGSIKMQVISMISASIVFGNDQINPSSSSNTPPNDQWPVGSTRLIGSLAQ